MNLPPQEPTHGVPTAGAQHWAFLVEDLQGSLGNTQKEAGLHQAAGVPGGVLSFEDAPNLHEPLGIK